VSSILRGRLKCLVNSIVYGDILAQVQLRLSREMLGEIDRWVSEGRFKSRSDAIKTIISDRPLGIGGQVQEPKRCHKDNHKFL